MVASCNKIQYVAQPVPTLWIDIPSEKVIGDYACRLGGSNCLLRRYVDP